MPKVPRTYSERDRMADIRKLKKFLRQYGSLEAMVAVLKPHPGFERLDRSVVYRWLTNPCIRTAGALTILESYSQEKKGKQASRALKRLEDLETQAEQIQRQLALLLEGIQTEIRIVRSSPK